MKPERLFTLISVALALLGFLITAYLSLQSLASDPVAGCGGDSGCAQVLASRWARLGPIPVALLGLLTYLAVLLGLGARMGSKGYSPLGDRLLWFAPPLLLIAAIWFTGAQLFSVGAICPFCMASHVIGFLLACLLLFGVMRTTITNPKPPLLAGFLASGALILSQSLLPPADIDVTRADNLFVDQDGDTIIDGKRYLSIFGGALQFTLDEMPYHGDPEAEQMVAVVFDYACPHCRELHLLLNEALKHDPKRFAVVALPISIHESVNALIESDDDRFADSFDLAKLSLAVAELDQSAWRDFDRWLFAVDEPDAFPRTLEQARAKASTLVEPTAIDELFEGNFPRPFDEQVGKHISVLGQLPEDKRFIPVTTTPGAPEHLTTRYEDIEVLYDLLESAELQE